MKCDSPETVVMLQRLAIASYRKDGGECCKTCHSWQDYDATCWFGMGDAGGMPWEGKCLLYERDD